MQNTRRISIWFWIAAGLLILAAAAYLALRLTLKTETIRPRQGPVIESVYGLGTVIAPQTFQVKTAVNQMVREIYVQEGDQVKTGDRLIRFDDSGVSRAPFAGTVTSVIPKAGELLFPSTPALTIVNMKDLVLEVSLEQQTILAVRPGLKAVISFESLRGDRLEATVKSVFPRDTQFIVRIVPERFPQGILPGMTADVAIEIARKENVLTIPLRAISSGKVSLIRGGKKIKQPVQLGVVDGEWAEVLGSSIEAGDEIIVRSK